MKTNMLNPLIVCVGLSITTISGSPMLMGNEIKGKTVAKAMIDREDGTSLVSRSIIISCEFSEVNGKRSCASSKRKKEFSSISVDSKNDHGLEKTVSILSYPKNEVGVGFLQVDKKQSNNDRSQQFVYLPALGKSKEIVSADQDSPKKGTLFGSEIAYEDIEKVYLQNYTFNWIKEETIDGRTTDIIWMIPTKNYANRTSYSKSKVWVDQKTKIPLKNELYDKRGQLAKTYFNRTIEKVGGYWFSKQQIVVNHKDNRMSLLKQVTTIPDAPVNEGLVSIRALTDKGLQSKIFRAH